MARILTRGLAERCRRRVGIEHVVDAAHVALFAHLLGGIPYSLTLHGDLGDYGPNQREKWVHCAFGLAVTRRLVAQLTEQLSGSLPASISVAPMGVDIARFTRRAPYEPWREGPARIFSCGRLNPGKGHSDLIRAVHLLRTRGLDARLAIAGEDDLGGTGYRHSLEALIAELGLSKSVTLLGAISEERVLEQLEVAFECEGRAGVLFEGEAGRLFVNRGMLSGKPVDELAASLKVAPKDVPFHPGVREKLYGAYPDRNSPQTLKAGKLDAIVNHMANFFDCVKDRKTPISDVFSQHRSASVCHLANISMRLGRKLKWDPAREEFVGDEEASRWLSRPQRSPYETRI